MNATKSAATAISFVMLEDLSDQPRPHRKDATCGGVVRSLVAPTSVWDL